MRRLIKKLFNFIYKEELKELKNGLTRLEELNKDCEERQTLLQHLLGNTNVSVDLDTPHSRHNRSWAVVSLQSSNTTFLKFIDLSEKNLREIAAFLRSYEGRRTVDANPIEYEFLRNELLRF